ncbi:MAG: hypothetical protein JW909_13605 [Planctomycetes bacterium]|nr:hypothetical protein [Planctomycetota bacterium]
MGDRVVCAVLATVLICGAVAGMQQPDSRVAPGKKFRVEFGELGQTTEGGGVFTEVVIPSNYVAGRKFPILVWIGGLNSTTAGTVQYISNNVTSGKDFIVASIPLPADGGSKCGWGYFERILNAIDGMIPNINTGRRMVGGQTEGAAAIAWQLEHSGGRFQEYFFGMTIGKGGLPAGKPLPRMNGNPVFLWVGGHDFKEVKNLRSLHAQLTAAGAAPRLLVSKEFLHDPPGSYCRMFLDWMNNEVIHRGLDEAKMRLDAAVKAKDWAAVAASATEVMNSSSPEMPQYAEAAQALGEASTHAEAKAEELLAGQHSVKDLREFMEDYGVCPAAEKVRSAANALGEQELAEIIKRGSMLDRKLRRFMEEWEGYPVCGQALDEYDKLAQAELDTVIKRSSKSMLAGKLGKFVKEWEPAPAVERAREMLEKEAAERLATAKGETSSSRRKYMLMQVVRTYPCTKAAGEAESLLVP